MKLHHGDCLEVLKRLTANSLDSLVTDPPAGISFMGKAWDDDKGGRDQWVAWMTSVMAECLRVLKPGAHGLVWAIPRTSHWTMTALENAGFEVRDVVTHLFGTGFPKSLDVSKAIDKAAGAEREKIGSVTKSVGDHHYDSGSKMGRFGSKAGVYSQVEIPVTSPATPEAQQWQGWGTALKPACEFWVLVRKPCSEKTVAANVLKWGTGALNIDAARTNGKPNTPVASASSGRFPSNLVLDEEAAQALDEQSGQLSQCGGPKKTTHDSGMFGIGTPGRIYREENRGASRFFYVAKASKSDKGADNTHPTVKSTALMSYLIKLVTPPKGIVLDPFMGSGSTGVSAKREGFKFIGIESEKAYFKTAEARVGA